MSQVPLFQCAGEQKEMDDFDSIFAADMDHFGSASGNDEPMGGAFGFDESLEMEPQSKRKRSAKGKGGEDPDERLQRSRERNKVHAKRSRMRKKFFLEGLKTEVDRLRDQKASLVAAVQSNVPEEEAKRILEKVSTDGGAFEGQAPLVGAKSGEGDKSGTELQSRDFTLVRNLLDGKQNFVISDPCQLDNPIIYASRGFCMLTGYDLPEIIGRNCRFLQGPKTDPQQVRKIRQGVADGMDTSVRLLNYKKDGTSFWNEFFVAALRDGSGKVVNYIGVQCEVASGDETKMRQLS
jgi:PAS domain S-box-containing protein